MLNEDKSQFAVAYFSMEIALENDLKTYAGGLGILAGDLLKSAAHAHFPMVGITLLNRQGYFKQTMSEEGEEIVQPETTFNFSKLEKLSPRVQVKVGTEEIKVGVWKYLIPGGNNFFSPVYFLDTDFPENSRHIRDLSGQLYGGDLEYRLKQEIVLGRAGVKMLEALGYKNIKKFHLNEGHGALAAIELFLDSSGKNNNEKVAEVRQQIVFTTHTPLKKEQDVFSLDYLKRYQLDFPDYLSGLVEQGKVNFTIIGLYFSAYTNAVSKLHQTVSQKLFPNYKIKVITNGVNSLNWTAPEFKKLYDHYIPNWRSDNSLLKKAKEIPLIEIWAAHQEAKKHLITYINEHSEVKFSEKVFTLGFARRFSSYKRPDFLFTNIDKLLRAQKKGGEIQIVYAGKAHSHDLKGKGLIKKIYELKDELADKIKITFLMDYDMDLAKLLTAGSDLWLNTPLPPNEASGTSGMKAAHNGVPQLSTLDGWWLEGYKENETGWAIVESRVNQEKPKSNIYNLLEKAILSLYYNNLPAWQEIMRSTISFNASYFNTDRALQQYIKEAYKLS